MCNEDKALREGRLSEALYLHLHFFNSDFPFPWKHPRYQGKFLPYKIQEQNNPCHSLKCNRKPSTSASINLCCYKFLLFFSLRSHFQPSAEQRQKILLPQLCLCTLMKDTAGQCSHQHRMPSPFSQDLMSLTPSATPRTTDGSHGWGKGKEESLLFHVHSAVQLVRASETQGQEEREGKQSMRNTGAPLQTGSTEPILNSFFPLVEAKPFSGQRPQSGNSRTASKHFQRRSPSALRHAQKNRTTEISAPFHSS